MPPRIWQDEPHFKNSAEKAIFDALYSALTPADAILTNAHFTDPKEGDCEIDVFALIQDLGAIIFETKGGRITDNGQTLVQSDRHEGRKIDPYDQALKNLYAFKAFLRPRWSYGNVKTEWMLGFPQSLCIESWYTNMSLLCDFYDIAGSSANQEDKAKAKAFA